MAKWLQGSDLLFRLFVEPVIKHAICLVDIFTFIAQWQLFWIARWNPHMTTQCFEWSAINASFKHLACSVFAGLGLDNVGHGWLARLGFVFSDWFGDCGARFKWCRRAHTSYTRAMPTYEFRCKTCDAVFEERRAMSQANDPASCAQGHGNSVRLLSVFASVGATVPQQAPAPRSGGGCGGGCACH